MDFKSQIEADVGTFLNPSEFGEEHVIDGKSVVCVLDESSDGEFDGDVDGVFVATRKLFVRDGDLAIEPRQGRRMVIDGEPYLALSISREMGMLAITVTARTV